jgi:hypothetical protein
MKLSEWLLVETYATCLMLKYPLGVAAIILAGTWGGGLTRWVWPVGLAFTSLLAWVFEWLAVISLAAFGDD